MLVVDASVLTKLLVEEERSEDAMLRLAREPHRIAPDLLTIEIASALTKKVRRFGLPLDTAREAFRSFPVLIRELVDSRLLIDRAIDLSAELDHSIFDCLYLALAIERGTTVLTDDRRFVKDAQAGGYGDHIEALF